MNHTVQTALCFPTVLDLPVKHVAKESQRCAAHIRRLAFPPTTKPRTTRRKLNREEVHNCEVVDILVPTVCPPRPTRPHKTKRLTVGRLSSFQDDISSESRSLHCGGDHSHSRGCPCRRRISLHCRTPPSSRVWLSIWEKPQSWNEIPFGLSMHERILRVTSRRGLSLSPHVGNSAHLDHGDHPHEKCSRLRRELSLRLGTFGPTDPPRRHIKADQVGRVSADAFRSSLDNFKEKVELVPGMSCAGGVISRTNSLDEARRTKPNGGPASHRHTDASIGEVRLPRPVVRNIFGLQTKHVGTCGQELVLCCGIAVVWCGVSVWRGRGRDVV